VLGIYLSYNLVVYPMVADYLACLEIMAVCVYWSPLRADWMLPITSFQSSTRDQRERGLIFLPQIPSYFPTSGIEWHTSIQTDLSLIFRKQFQKL
jgi:hypothetical protein